MVSELVKSDVLGTIVKLPAAFLYLLPWALAHSEDVKDLERACEVIDMSVTAYPNFNLFEGRNKYVATRHLKVLEKSVGIYKEISNFSARVLTQKNLVNDKDNQPI